MLGDLWRHRSYIWGGALLELRERYAGSAMGLLWHILIPLAQISLYLLLLPQIMSIRGLRMPTGENYALFLCAGILPWFVFSECVSRGSTAFLVSTPYLRKLDVPESVFVAQTAVSSGLSFGIYIPVLVAAAAFMGTPPHWTWLLIPPLLALFLALGFGLGIVLATLTVFFRDVAQVVGFALYLWFWLTPVVYSETQLAPPLATLVRWNPATAFIESLRDLLLRERLPGVETWLWMLLLAVSLPAAGAALLSRTRSDLRDAL